MLSQDLQTSAYNPNCLLLWKIMKNWLYRHVLYWGKFYGDMGTFSGAEMSTPQWHKGRKVLTFSVHLFLHFPGFKLCEIHISIHNDYLSCIFRIKHGNSLEWFFSSLWSVWLNCHRLASFQPLLKDDCQQCFCLFRYFSVTFVRKWSTVKYHISHQLHTGRFYRSKSLTQCSSLFHYLSLPLPHLSHLPLVFPSPSHSPRLSLFSRSTCPASSPH